MASSLFSRYNSYQRRYALLKANPELYAKRLEEQRRRYRNKTNEQRIKWNASQNEWRKSMRRVAKDIGNCSFCFKEKENPSFKMCSSCRIKTRKYYKKKVKGGIEDDKNITNKDSNI
jgi:hypothetical protein